MISSFMDNHDASIHHQLTSLLDKGKARYNVVHHASAGKSDEVALIRGTEVGQGAKALACELIFPDGTKKHVLAVMPADRKLDQRKLACLFDAKKANLLEISATRILTQCEIGAIPPFTFAKNLILVCDPQLIDRYPVIAFNAGRLDISILLNTDDYLALAQPILAPIISLQ
jgi:Ala-tRNA(Pro) deacylase